MSVVLQVCLLAWTSVLVIFIRYSGGSIGNAKLSPKLFISEPIFYDNPTQSCGDLITSCKRQPRGGRKSQWVTEVSRINHLGTMNLSNFHIKSIR